MIGGVGAVLCLLLIPTMARTFRKMERAATRRQKAEAVERVEWEHIQREPAPDSARIGELMRRRQRVSIG